LLQYAASHFEPPKKKTLTKRKTVTLAELTAFSNVSALSHQHVLFAAVGWLAWLKISFFILLHFLHLVPSPQKPLTYSLTKEAAPLFKEAVDISKKILSFMSNEESSTCSYIIRKVLAGRQQLLPPSTRATN
jgi:hypothetical protein